jgi:hypothetical protein
VTDGGRVRTSSSDVDSGEFDSVELILLKPNQSIGGGGMRYEIGLEPGGGVEDQRRVLLIVEIETCEDAASVFLWRSPLKSEASCTRLCDIELYGSRRDDGSEDHKRIGDLGVTNSIEGLQSELVRQCFLDARSDRV